MRPAEHRSNRFRKWRATALMAAIACITGLSACCAVVGPESTEPAEEGTVTKYFSRYLDPEREHPYLFVSPEELAGTAERLFEREEELLVSAHAAVAAQADPDAEHVADSLFGESRRTFTAAYLSALHKAAGHEEEARTYSESARRALLAFAEHGVAERREGTGYLAQNYLIGLAFAYDLVWNDPAWTADDREKMRGFFYSAVDELVTTMHSKHLSNHAAWAQARVSTTAFLFKDEALAAECMEGPDGYAGRIAHMFFDDGLIYEKSSWQYQNYGVLPVFFTALAARGAGAEPDPLTLRVENDLSLVYLGGSTGDFTMPFYPTDTAEFVRPAEKTFAGALTAQLDMLRPDTTCPSIGDYGYATPRMADYWSAELAWDLFGDPRAARILSMGERKAEGAHPFGEGMLTLAFGKPLPESPRFESVSTIYPHAGYAVMKSIEGDAYWESDAICANLFFGPFGNGHGQADKLALEISGAGHKCCIEEIYRPPVEWQYWNSTVSHNSVVVGEKSQPGNEDMFTIDIESCGRLLFHRFEPRFKVASAECLNVYQGLTKYRRTVGVAAEYVVDVFEVESPEPTVFDWFLHGRDGVAVEGVDLEPSQIGKGGHGYEFFTEVKSGTPGGAVKARFGAGHTVFVPEAAGLEVFSAAGPWKEEANRPVLILRKRGRSAVFAVVHDPSGTAVRGAAVERDADGGFALVVEANGRRDRVVFEKDGGGVVLKD